MDFQVTTQQQAAQQRFRAFAQQYVKPFAQQIDETETFPLATVQQMAAEGMMGLPVPTAYGGQGCDTVTYALCIQELSKVCATTAVIVSAHTSLVVDPILQYGTDAQKQKYLPALASGKSLGAFALTEAGAGTDAQGQQTTAQLLGDTWVLNGEKIFITNAAYADVFIVFAVTGTVTDKRGRQSKEISAFIVERDAPGFAIGAEEKKMGIRGSSTCSLIFTNCAVPVGNMLGAQGKGFGIAMATLDGGRIGIAAQALGIAEGAIAEAIAYTSQRVQFGKPIAAQQNTQFVLAELATKAKAAQYLVYAAASKKDAVQNGLQARYSQEAAMAKLFAAEAAIEITSRCLQLFGGYGYTRDYPIERMMRDARITALYEGTSEVQKMVIAGELLRPAPSAKNASSKVANKNDTSDAAQVEQSDALATVAAVLKAHLPLAPGELSVVVGRGIAQNPAEGVALANALVQQLGGGTVGATRAVTQSGWVPHTQMIGQTGKSVSPKVYVALGVSGAPQHLCGVQPVADGCVVAINQNVAAPICTMADYTLTGDLFTLVPALIKALQEG